MRKIHYIILALIIAIIIPRTAYASEISILPSGLNYSELEKTIDTYAKENENTTAAVSVAIFSGKDILFEKSYGCVDIENNVVNDNNSVFEWGSCTKLLVWVSVMQLVEKGELDLEKDIRAYLPDGFLTKIRYDEPITLTNLMNHNAGWQEIVTDLFLKNESDVVELGEALQIIEPEQIHKPGTVVAYSNWGSALAGYIVERVSGQSFSDYVQEHIFKPLNMNHTALNSTLSDNEWVAKRRALQKCYTTENESLGTSLYYLSLYPAGMAMGTLNDFVKFAQALTTSNGERSLLFEEVDTLDKMLSPTLFYADGKTARNCHGFWTDELGVPVVWHNGGTVGSTSWFTLDIESGIGMVTLTNQSSESVYNCGLLPLIFGEYKNENIIKAEEDISGVYVSSRTCFLGYAKLYNMVCHTQLSANGKGGYTMLGSNFILTGMDTGKYFMNMGNLKQFVVYSDTSHEEHTVLQMPGFDYIEVNGYGLIAKCVLLISFMIAALYSFLGLIFRISRFIKSTKITQPMSGYRDAVHLAVISSLMIFVYISVTLFSYTAMFKTIKWSIVLNAALAMIPVLYTFILAFKWKKIDCGKKEKVKLICTNIAGLIMFINVIYWGAYRFW